MDKNLGEKIAEILIEQSAKTIGLYPGGFKPSHRGHFEVAKRAAQHVDELHIIISNNIREGYTPELSLKIWNQYLPLLPENIKVKISKSPSPITEIYNIVKDKTNNYIVVYGKGEKDRYNSINENREKYSNVDIIDAGNFDNISATSLREAIRTRNKLAIKSLIPEGIKVDDFLMNFQIHEIKVNQPNIFPSQLLPYKDKIDYYIKYTPGDIEEKTMDTINYIIQGTFKGDWNIPGLNSPQELKDDTLPKLAKQLQHYIKLKHLNEEKIPGGLASGLTLQDIADKHKANISSLRKQLQKGIKVELEHTTSKQVAEEIAMDHLFEDPKYYDKLATIENDTVDEIKVNKPGIDLETFKNRVRSKDQEEVMYLWRDYNWGKPYATISSFFDSLSNDKKSEVYNKMSSLKDRKNRIDEAKQVGDIYHFTNLNGLQGILDSNSFSGSSTEVDKFSPDFKSFRKKESDFKDKGIKYLNYFSTTRNKDFWKKDPAIGGSLARIKLDGNKLSNTYKFVPFYYYPFRSNQMHPKIENDESEERINLGTKTEIPNAKNYIKEIDIFLDKLGDNTRVLNLIKELQTKYPQIKTLYKDKEMSADQYISDILPSIEPYDDVDEIKVNKPNVPIVGKWYLVDEYGTDDWLEAEYKGRFQDELPSGHWDYASFISPNYESYTIDWDKIQGRIKKIPPKGLNEVFSKQHAPILDKAVKWGCKYLDVPKPDVILINNPNYTKEYSSFGGYSPGDKSIRVVTHNRNLADITRSMFHEMNHLKQDLEGRLKPESGKDGDEWENEANANAGTMMRKFSRENPEIFE